LVRSITCLSCTADGPQLATGVTGKECVCLVEPEDKALVEDKTLVIKNCLDVDACSCGPCEEGVPGIRRTVLSPPGVEFLVLRLLCGKRLLMDDFALVEIGLGGKPALTEPGLDKTFDLAEGNGISRVLADGSDGAAEFSISNRNRDHSSNTTPSSSRTEENPSIGHFAPAIGRESSCGDRRGELWELGGADF
ncbi:hypothetical protein BHM03_00061952, partial [Ensete ventricosum]